METEQDNIIPSFRQAALARVRRRCYVALIMATGVYIVGLLYWPLSAATFRTIAELSVQLETPGPSRGNIGATLANDIESLGQTELRLQQLLRQCLSDEALASTIQLTTSAGARSGIPTGMAPVQIADVRKHLQVGLASIGSPAGQVKRIQIEWTGPKSGFAARFVDTLTQEIAGRFARDIRVQSIQRKLEDRFDQIAQQQTEQATQLLRLISTSKRQLERHRLSLLALQQQLGDVEVGDHTESLAIQAEVDSIRQQLLNSDTHLLTLLRQQLMHHFEVDETDGMVQHIERLIHDRQAVLAKMGTTNGGPASSGLVRTLEASHSSPPTDSRVRTNPFFTASAQVMRQQTQNTQLRELNELMVEVQAQPLANELNAMQAMLEIAAQQKVPVLPIANLIQRETSPFRVVHIRPATTGAPLDLMPSQSWAFGLATLALMFGIAFTLQNSPESLVRSILRPTQLARFLGVEHLGTIKTGRQAPNFVDQAFRQLGRRVFQAAEVLVLLSCIGIVMAMVWDAELPSILLSNPVEGVCRAFWILLGR